MCAYLKDGRLSLAKSAFSYYYLSVLTRGTSCSSASQILKVAITSEILSTTLPLPFFCFITFSRWYFRCETLEKESHNFGTNGIW